MFYSTTAMYLNEKCNKPSFPRVKPQKLDDDQLK